MGKYLIFCAVLLVLVGCGSSEGQVVVETVIHTKIVEQEVTREVPVTIEIDVPRDVEVTRLVEVEVTREVEKVVKEEVEKEVTRVVEKAVELGGHVKMWAWAETWAEVMVNGFMDRYPGVTAEHEIIQNYYDTFLASLVAGAGLL